MFRCLVAILAALFVMPQASGALTVDPSSTLAHGQSYDIGDAPFHWGASFEQGDGPGSVWFRFENSNPGAVDATGAAQGTVLQFSGAFEYLTAAWTGGQSTSVLPGQTAIVSLSSLILAGGEDRLTISWGPVTGAHANIDFAVDVAPVPIPAGLGLLALGLAGLGLAGRRRSAV